MSPEIWHTRGSVLPFDCYTCTAVLKPVLTSYCYFLQEAFKAAGVETMDECFNFAVKLHSHKRMVGTRKVNSEEDEMQPNGKMFQKWDMGDYSWKSYAEVRLKSDLRMNF